MDSDEFIHRWENDSGVEFMNICRPASLRFCVQSLAFLVELQISGDAPQRQLFL